MPTYNPSDVRSFKKMLSDQQVLLTQQAAELATTGAKLVTLETTMVIENVFTVAKAAFTFANDVWTYNLVHGMNTIAPGVEVFDAGGDVQTVQTIVIDDDTLQLEFSQLEYDGNNFPLAVSIQAKNSPVVYVPGLWEAIPGDIGELRLLGGKVEYTLDGGATITREVFPGRIASEALIANSRVYATVENGDLLETLIGTWEVQGSERGDYNDAKASVSAIVL